jgi:hypothetical protein
MNPSSTDLVEEYLQNQPPERREVLLEMRRLILENLPAGYREAFNWGMISYEIPLERYPNTYNRQPLSVIALAAQKNYYALHLMCVYGDPQREAWLREAFQQAGKKLDMGKACLRFRRLDDLPLDVIRQLVAGVTPEAYIARYEQVRQSPRKKSS